MKKIRKFGHQEKLDEITNNKDIGCRRQVNRLKLLCEESWYDLQDVIDELITEMYQVQRKDECQNDYKSTVSMLDEIENAKDKLLKFQPDNPEDAITYANIMGCSIKSARSLLLAHQNDILTHRIIELEEQIQNLKAAKFQSLKQPAYD